MNAFFANIWHGIKNDLKVDDDNCFLLLIGCVFITLFIFLSFFTTFFSYFAIFTSLAFGLVLNIKHKNTYSSLPLLFYLFSFSAVLNIINLKINIFSVITAIQTFAMAIEILIKMIQKELKPNWWLFASAFLLITYIAILFFCKWFSFSSVLSLYTGIVLVIDFVYFKDEIDFKELGLFLCFGLLISCFLGLFYKYYPSLKNFFDITYAYNSFRFSGLFPNTNGLTYYGVFVLSIVFALFLRKEINIIFYPLLVAFLSILIATVSKTVLVICGVMMAISMLLLLLKIKIEKKNLLVVLGLVFCLLVSVAINYNNFKVILQRTSTPFQDKIQDEENDGTKPSIPSEILSEYTTGRTDIWKGYLKDSFSSSKTALFGTRLGRNYSIGDNIGKYGCHNIVVEIIFNTGVVGLVLVVFYIYVSFTFFAKRFNVNGVLPIISTGLSLCLTDLFSYVVFMYYVLVLMASYNRKIDNPNLKIVVKGDESDT